jgi:hypothetical protein
MKTLLLAMMLLPQVALADGWLCEEESSQREGSTIKSCGIGIGATEAQARSKALSNARAEFDDVCSGSSDCAGKAVIVVPRRTDCKATDNGYTCHRLVSFQIQDEKGADGTARVASTALRCYVGCDSKDHSACWLPGAMFAWNHGCQDSYQRPFHGEN